MLTQVYWHGENIYIGTYSTNIKNINKFDDKALRFLSVSLDNISA